MSKHREGRRGLRLSDLRDGLAILVGMAVMGWALVKIVEALP